MNKQKLLSEFDDWLVSYQPDLERIIGKHRLSRHALEHQELLSEINQALIRDKEKIITKRGIENFNEFKKIAYSYARNYTKWTSDGCTPKDKKYYNNKIDTVADTSDGQKTFFELTCETQGGLDQSFVDIFSGDSKYSNLRKWILDYSHFLTPRQKNILIFAMKGYKLYDIGEAIGVTHQAISAALKEIEARLLAFIKKSDINKSESKLIEEGQTSVNFLFGTERCYARSSITS